jgi:signal transduction histidine kinase
MVDGSLVVKVADDGTGFDAEAETCGKSGHFGCVGIRERSRKIGATVHWSSFPGRGATLAITVPLTGAKVTFTPARQPALAETVI